MRETGKRSEPVHRVTLVTGDRLTVVGGNKIAVAPAPGRTGIRFLTRTMGGHTYAIPIDALPLLRAHRLDPRLFDVTTLIGYGYTDERADLPLIVRYAATGARPSLAAGRAATRSALTAPGVKVTRDLAGVRVMAIRAATDAADELWRRVTGTAAGVAARNLRPGIASVWLDGLRKPSLDVSVPQIGAPAAWARGFDGTGQTVAVLDTGIDATHPDLAGRVSAEENFTEGAEDDRDLVGHGTHVASTIAGSGAASNGRYRGVAPGARLLDGKVCVEFGCAESWMLAGMQWAADNGASVVNMSIGGPDFPGLDPVEEAVETLTAERGTLFVVAAGNAGPGAGTVSSPGSAPSALTVGAVTKTEELADFSGQGLTVENDLKPDLTGPGVDITAANSKDGFLGQPGEPYTTLSGTSMATPHVAGAAAILHQRHPDWSATRLKAALMASSAPNAALAAHEQGAGRVDVARAIDQSVVATPPGVSFGRALWPHDDDQPIARTVTYTNLATTARTLTLSLTTTGPGGEPAPAGAFTVTPTTLTVPAGGEASATITADTRVGDADGLFGGRLTATSGGVVVQTPFGVNREVESYDVTLVHTDRGGAPAADYFTTLIRIDEFAFYDVFDPDGTVSARVPKGEYMVVSLIFDSSTEPFQQTFLMQPRLEVNGPETVRLDARRARPVRITVPDRTVAPAIVEVAGLLITPEVFVDVGVLSDGIGGLFTGQAGPAGDIPDFRSRVHATFANLTADGLPINSRNVYVLTWFVPGHFVTGYRRSVRPGELATIRADYLRHLDAGMGVAFAEPTDVSTGGLALVLPFDLPFARTEFYTTENVRWIRIFHDTEALDSFDPITFFVREAHTLRAGSRTTDQWNHTAFGPTLLDAPLPELWASRTGDSLLVAPPIFGDGLGREGFSLTTSERTVVSRNGTVISDEPFLGAFVDVAPEAATYRVAMRAERGAPFTLGTVVEAAWTFRSSHVDGDASVRLPLSVVSFTPLVDRTNTAPAGRVALVPLTVTGQSGSAAGRVASLSVDVSYDDGATWRRAPVVNLLGQRLVVLAHPDRAGFVSLRTRVEDTRHNVVEQTVIHAYRIAPKD